MRLLTRYILKEMTTPTLLGLIFYTSIILMKTMFDLAGLIIRQSLPAATVGRLLALSLPHIVVLTMPMSLLFGILIAVGRLSSDSEIIAMRALGISTRTIYRPVFLFSFTVFLLTLYLMNTILPRSNAELQRMRTELLTTGAQKEIKPRVFFDDFENTVVYVNDVDERTGEWTGVFVADNRIDEPKDVSTPAKIVAAAQQPDQSASAGAFGQRSGGQKVSVASRGTITVVKPQGQIWLNLYDATTHFYDPRRPDRYDVNANRIQRVFLGDKVGATDPARFAKSLREMTVQELWEQQKWLARTNDRESYNLAWVEIHKKFSIPFACITFGVLGLPLGITNRRGGKSSGFSLSIAIILFYYVMLNNGEAFAAAGRITPFLGMWSANILLLAVGIYLLIRANRETNAPRREKGLVAKITAAISRLTSRRSETVTEHDAPTVLSRLDITFPNIIDRYVLREFLKVLFLVLVSTAALFIIVDYTDIANSIRTNHIPFHIVAAYYRFLIFQVLNWTLPISVLVATLVTFSMLAKNNEVTAIKSGGVSLFRVAMPIVFVAVVISVFAYFLLDFVLPYSNRKVETLNTRIRKGKEAATATAMQQKLWMAGKGRYLLNFLAYNHDTHELTQVQIFELHPTQWRLSRRVYAQNAKWNGHAWEFSNGWMRSFPDDAPSTYTTFTAPIQLSYKETPEDFESEVRTPDQMTFAELRRYIETIRRSGYSAEALSVRLYMKTSWPVLSVVMALIALPFAFKVGKRGALYGVGIALVLGIVYWMVYVLFTKFGEVGNLPPLLAAWSANILFSIAAVYLFLHVET
jgi:LPS export ABC transporter permease LptG